MAILKQPRQIADISRMFSNRQITQAHYREKVVGNNRVVAVWKRDNVTAKVCVEGVNELSRICTPQVYKPFLGVNASKNLDALAYMLQRRNLEREKDRSSTYKFSFQLVEYAKVRGYSEEDVSRGGKFIENLQKDLCMGANTSYELKDFTIYDTERENHNLPSFYTLNPPKAKKGKWQVIFSEPYRYDYMNPKPYYPIAADCIADKGKKGYLYFFMREIIRSCNHPGRIKVQTLLNYVNIPRKTLARPKESFRLLCEGIYYTGRVWKPLKEVVFSALKDGLVKAVEPITVKEFKGFSYSRMQKILRKLEVVDVRDVSVTFCNSRRKAQELKEVRAVVVE